MPEVSNVHGSTAEGRKVYGAIYGARISPYVLSVTVHFFQHPGIRSDSSPGVTKESGSAQNWSRAPNEEKERDHDMSV